MGLRVSIHVADDGFDLCPGGSEDRFRRRSMERADYRQFHQIAKCPDVHPLNGGPGIRAVESEASSCRRQIEMKNVSFNAFVESGSWAS
jgi:hypothetical protein